MLSDTHNYKFAKHYHCTLTIVAIFIILFSLLTMLSSALNTGKINVARASNVKQVSMSVGDSDIQENVDKQLGEIDFSNLDSDLSSLGNLELDSIGASSFIEIVKKFLSGENGEYYNNFFSYAVNILFKNLLSYIPFFAIIIALSIAFSLMGHFGGDKSSISTTLHIILFCTISAIILKLVSSLISGASSGINSMQLQLEAIFPILLTLITAIGSSATATTFQPMLAIFSSSISKLFSYLLIPLFIFSIVFSVIGNLSKNIKLEKFSKFFSSFYGYTIGVVFTIFMAFLTIHGLNVATIDSISLKTAKFAIKSYVPMLGGYLSDGISIILASSMLIKNAIGVSGLVLMLFKIFSPIINIILVILLLRLSSAILEPICDKEVPDFLYSVSKSLVMIIVAILAVGLMYVISISILLSCSNLF